MEMEQEHIEQPQAEETQVESLEDLHRLAEEGLEAESQETQQSEEVVEEPEAPSYEPNYTYTVRDEQREFDERIRDVIKDKDTEEYLRDLYTRADGLETYKEKFSKRESEYKELYEHAQALTGGYQKLQQLREKNDHRGLQKALGLSDDFVIEWGLALAEEGEMPEEQRMQIQKQREMEEKLQAYENRISQFESSVADNRVQEDLRQLQSLTMSNDVRPIAEAMSERGHDFIETVVAMGQFEFQKTGVEPSIESVVRRVADQYRYLVPQEQPQQQTIEQPKQTVQQPTLPSVGGTNQATVDKPITSMEDLKRLADSI